jgi:hypothetical protein
MSRISSASVRVRRSSTRTKLLAVQRFHFMVSRRGGLRLTFMTLTLRRRLSLALQAALASFARPPP